jgi:RNA polymerase sigma-70 factor (ECF subfamily)
MASARVRSSRRGRSSVRMALVAEEDDAIVAEVLGGRSARFEILIRRHGARIFRIGRAILRDDGDAEDAAQQAWLAAYENLAQWDGRARFSSWLTRIVANAAFRRLRARGRTEGLSVAGHGPAERDHAAPPPTPEDEAARFEARVLLERAIDALPEPFRVVVVLRDLEELSSAETADALGVSEQAVRVRLHRARRALRAQLEQVSARAVGDVLALPCDGRDPGLRSLAAATS